MRTRTEGQSLTTARLLAPAPASPQRFNLRHPASRHAETRKARVLCARSGKEATAFRLSASYEETGCRPDPRLVGGVGGTHGGCRRTGSLPGGPPEGPYFFLMGFFGAAFCNAGRFGAVFFTGTRNHLPPVRIARHACTHSGYYCALSSMSRKFMTAGGEFFVEGLGPPRERAAHLGARPDRVPSSERNPFLRDAEWCGEHTRAPLVSRGLGCVRGSPKSREGVTTNSHPWGILRACGWRSVPRSSASGTGWPPVRRKRSSPGSSTNLTARATGTTGCRSSRFPPRLPPTPLLPSRPNPFRTPDRADTADQFTPQTARSQDTIPWGC